ncbi:MAG TPA: hypothetical protein PKJ37_00700 [Acidobacteriota bacterium]|nr:hypothetical protein [Acidobacteriota bacterium]HNT16398.1 hypothetical protein [Acidobacteriota bacterium]
MIELPKEYFHTYKNKPVGFFVGCIMLYLVVILPTDGLLKDILDEVWLRWVIYLILFFGWFVTWYLWKEHYPKNLKNRIGIAVSITAEDDDQKIRIKNDFIKNMNAVSKKKKLDDLLNIVCFEECKAQMANELFMEYQHEMKKLLETKRIKDFQKSKKIKMHSKLINKTHFHLYIWGSVIKRKEGEEKYYLTFNAMVRHVPKDFSVTKEASKEFNAILPKEVVFDEAFEVSGFQVTAEMIFLASQYMIGWAALVSGDPNTAYNIHNTLLADLSNFKPQPPNIVYIYERTRSMLIEELIQKAINAYAKADIKSAKAFVAKAEKIDKNNYSIVVSKAYYAFLIDGDAYKALDYCRAAGILSDGDGTWLYNQAFLNMYIENYETAYSYYTRIKDNIFKNEVVAIDRCTRFNESYFQQNPTFYASLFILGFLYYYKINNAPVALEKLESFLDTTKEMSKYSLLRERTEEVIIEIKNDMGLT